MVLAVRNDQMMPHRPLMHHNAFYTMADINLVFVAADPGFLAGLEPGHRVLAALPRNICVAYHLALLIVHMDMAGAH
jgi:hypothetical protein